MANATTQIGKKNLVQRMGVRTSALMRRFLQLAAGRDISSGAQLKDAAFTLPNALTLARLMMTPLVLILFLADRFEAAFWVFVAAALTDMADGWIAKSFNAQTRLGAFIDPMADKILTASAYLTLGIAGFVPQWLVVMIISRDVLLVAGMLVTWIAYDRIWVAPLAIGKLTTFAQLSVVGLVLLDKAVIIPGNLIGILIYYGIYIAGILTLLSLAAYFLQWFARVAILGGEDPKEVS